MRSKLSVSKRQAMSAKSPSDRQRDAQADPPRDVQVDPPRGGAHPDPGPGLATDLGGARDLVTGGDAPSPGLEIKRFARRLKAEVVVTWLRKTSRSL